MLNQIILWSSLIVPWLSLLFLKKDIVKRYMPVAIFTSLLVTIYNELGYTFEWWVVKQTLFPWIITFVSFVYGGFLVGTIWIFYFTYRKFWLYLITNIVVDFLFMFPVNNWFERLGIYQLINRENWQIFLDFVFISVIIYFYQLWQEGVLIKSKEEDSESGFDFKNFLRRKEKAR
jgi:hypothetical protein